MSQTAGSRVWQQEETEAILRELLTNQIVVRIYSQSPRKGNLTTIWHSTNWLGLVEDAASMRVPSYAFTSKALLDTIALVGQCRPSPSVPCISFPVVSAQDLCNTAAIQKS